MPKHFKFLNELKQLDEDQEIPPLFDDPVKHAEYLDLLAFMYYKEGNMEKAEEISRESISVKMECMYENHPEIHKNVYLLAKMAFKQ